MSAWNIIINANQRNGYTYTYTSLKGVGNWVEHTSAGIKTWGKLASSVNGSILLATDAVSSNIPSVSTNTGYLYVSTDGGNNWSQKTDAGNRLWSSLSVSSDGTKMIASVENGNIYISSDTGSNWAPDSSAGSRSWNSIATSSDNSKIVTALTDSNVYTSDDSGSSWEYRGAIGGTTGTLKFKLSTSAWNIHQLLMIIIHSPH
jgi:photosystem II stability/assembly factor-like uncharacterized protein